MQRRSSPLYFFLVPFLALPGTCRRRDMPSPYCVPQDARYPRHDELAMSNAKCPLSNASGAPTSSYEFLACTLLLPSSERSFIWHTVRLHDMRAHIEEDLLGRKKEPWSRGAKWNGRCGVLDSAHRLQNVGARSGEVCFRLRMVVEGSI